jgi:hypothetical protein
MCSNNPTLWRESTDAANAALTARIRLWDSILIAFEQEELEFVSSPPHCV